MGQLVELHAQFRPHTARSFLRRSIDVTEITSETSPIRRVLNRSFADSPEFVEYISRELEKHYASVMVAELFVEALRPSIGEKFRPVQKRLVVRFSDIERRPHVTKAMRQQGHQFVDALFKTFPASGKKKCMGIDEPVASYHLPRPVDYRFAATYVFLFYRALAMVLES